MKYSLTLTRPSGVAQSVSRAHQWRRRAAAVVVASSVVVANLTLIDVGIGSADQDSTTTPVITLAAPAVGSTGVFSVSFTLPGAFTLPTASDDVTTDTFTYAVVGTNSAGCVLSSDSTQVTFSSAGTCVIEVTSVPAPEPSSGWGYAVGSHFPFGFAWGWHRHHHFDDDDDTPVATADLTLSVAAAGQSIRLSSRAARLHSSVPLVATGYLGTGNVSYGLVGGSATGCSIALVNAKNRLTSKSPGTCLVVARIGADGQYLAASSHVAVFRFLKPRVVIDAQSITLASSRVHYGASVQLDATGYRGTGAVTYQVTGGTATNCSIDANDVLSAGGAGTCVVTASIAPSAGFAAASSPPATVTFEAKPAPPRKVVPPPPAPPATVVRSVVPFDEGSDVLTPSLDAQIQAIATLVVSKKYHVVDLTAYTDNVFTPAFNLALNQNRAMAVETQLQADLMTAHASGVSVVIVAPASTPSTTSFQPDSNVTAQGRAYNRRVVATLKAS